MYEEDITNWDEPKRKEYRDKRLEELPDVLFKLFDPVYPSDMKNLSGLLFRPSTNPLLWILYIINKYPDLTAQLIYRQVKKPVRDVILIKGSSEEMQKFCEQFRKLLQTFNPEEDLEGKMKTLAVKEEVPKS